MGGRNRLSPAEKSELARLVLNGMPLKDCVRKTRCTATSIRKWVEAEKVAERKLLSSASNIPPKRSTVETMTIDTIANSGVWTVSGPQVHANGNIVKTLIVEAVKDYLNRHGVVLT